VEILFLPVLLLHAKSGLVILREGVSMILLQMKMNAMMGIFVRRMMFVQTRNVKACLLLAKLFVEPVVNVFPKLENACLVVPLSARWYPVR
jgi:hypothetical protein